MEVISKHNSNCIDINNVKIAEELDVSETIADVTSKHATFNM